MTFREKLQMEHPDSVDKSWFGGCKCCPTYYGYESRANEPCKVPGSIVDDDFCKACWDREIPGTEKTVETVKEKENMADTKKTKAMLLEEIADLRKKVERLNRYQQYEEAAGDLHAMLEAFTNSGFTREEAFTMLLKMFDTAGAVLGK